MPNNVVENLSAPQKPSDEIDLLGLLATIWRGKWLILLFAIFTTLAGGYYAFAVAKPMFRATTVLVLDEQQPSLVDFDSIVPGVSSELPALNTEVEVIKSRKLLQRLVEQMDLTADPEFNVDLRPESPFSVSALINLIRPTEDISQTDQQVLDATIDQVLSRINVRTVTQTYVFHITVTSESAEKSAEIANTLAEIYILDQMEVKFELTQRATEWLTTRVDELRIELERTEAAAEDFLSNSSLVSPEALIALNRQIKEFRDRRESLETSRAEAVQLLATLSAAKDDGDYAEMIQIVQDRLRISNRTDIIDGNGNAQAVFLERVDQFRTALSLESDTLAQQLESLNRSIADLEANSEAQSAELVTLQQFEREAEASRLIFEYFLSRLKETSVQQGIQQPDSRVLSVAAVPTSPSSPRRMLISAIALILGVGIGTLLVILNELRNVSFRTSSELENLTGLRVLGQIPLIPSRKRANVIAYLAQKPNSAAAEAIRNLRTSIIQSDVDNPPKVIMSTSSLPGEGKTTQSLSLAQNFSGLGKKVLLIEGDVRRRVFKEYFKIKGGKGLIAVLAGDAEFDEVVSFVDEIGADVLIGEKSNANAADIFSSKKFAAFLQTAREKYDYVIIDTPPVLVVPDARVIGQSVDAIIYSVKWDSTTKTQVREGIKMFQSVGQKVTGLVFSQIDPKGMKKYGYGGEYGAYGAYGSKYYNED